MATKSHDINELEKRMRGVIESLKREFSGLRTGRASVNILDPITVDVYGQKMPLNQLGNVSVPEAENDFRPDLRQGDRLGSGSGYS